MKKTVGPRSESKLNTNSDFVTKSSPGKLQGPEMCWKGLQSDAHVLQKID
jgi:hypothetical protein